MGRKGKQLDGNRQPVGDYITLKKTIAFDGGTTDGVGDIDGANNPATIFTVTGTCLVKLFAVCTTSLVGDTATVEVGVSGGTATLIAQTTATDIDAGEIWHDASPDAKVEASSVAAEKIVANGEDIILTAATANVTAGVLDFILQYIPLTDDAKIEV